MGSRYSLELQFELVLGLVSEFGSQYLLELLSVLEFQYLLVFDSVFKLEFRCLLV